MSANHTHEALRAMSDGHEPTTDKRGRVTYRPDAGGGLRPYVRVLPNGGLWAVSADDLPPARRGVVPTVDDRETVGRYYPDASAWFAGEGDDDPNMREVSWAEVTDAVADGWEVYPVAGDDAVMVIGPVGVTWRIHREDADPEHRFVMFRLAASWFGNEPAA